MEDPVTIKTVSVKVTSELESIDGTFKDINITITEDGTPRAVAFFDIDMTLTELKTIHNQAIKVLFKEFFDKEFKDIEDVYAKGFKLGNSFREFDRMNGIYNLGYRQWIDPEIYIQERLNEKKGDIDNEGTETHNIAKIYLDRYSQIASDIADEIYKNHPEEFELSKIKPVFAIARFYKAMGVPLFGITANGRKFVHTIAKYLGLSELFIGIACDEDMVGGGKEISIPKLITKLESIGIKVPKDRLVMVGDSLSGDIGSAYRYNTAGSGLFMKGILVLHDNDELKKVKSQVALSPELQNIIKVTDTEAFVVGNVKYDSDGDPLLFSVDNNFLIKL